MSFRAKLFYVGVGAALPLLFIGWIYWLLQPVAAEDVAGVYTRSEGSVSERIKVTERGFFMQELSIGTDRYTASGEWSFQEDSSIILDGLYRFAPGQIPQRGRWVPVRWRGSRWDRTKVMEVHGLYRLTRVSRDPL